MMPAGDVDMNTLPDVLRVTARYGGDSSKEFDAGRFGSFMQSKIGQQLCRSGEKERLDLRLVQSGQVGAIFFQQAPAAIGTTFGDYRNASHTQRLHIAMDSAFGHLQALRQFMGRHTTMYL